MRLRILEGAPAMVGYTLARITSEGGGVLILRGRLSRVASKVK